MNGSNNDGRVRFWEGHKTPKVVIPVPARADVYAVDRKWER